LLEIAQLKDHLNQEPGHKPVKVQSEDTTIQTLDSVELTVTRIWDHQENKSHKSFHKLKMSHQETKVLQAKLNNRTRKQLRSKGKERKMREGKESKRNNN